MKKKTLIWIGGLTVAVFFIGMLISFGSVNGYAVLNDFEGDIAIYKSSSCGCCTIYGDYFRNKGNSNAKIITTEDSDSIKTKHKIPSELKSCHTTIIGDYFVEGHIPLEAVNKLLEEKPDIAGIAMPGMPSGSPGMPGPKNGDFVIYAVDHNGGYEEFMRI